MALPDVIGYTLGDARALLAEEGFLIRSVEVTGPPKQEKTGYTDDFRVIGQKIPADKNMDLIVCKPL